MKMESKEVKEKGEMKTQRISRRGGYIRMKIKGKKKIGTRELFTNKERGLKKVNKKQKSQ